MSSDDTSTGMGSKVAKGAMWSVAFRMADRSLGLISTLILARLLAPADFGIVAMAVTLITLTDVVTVGEFSSAIIHEPNPTRGHYDSAWTMSALFGLAATAMLLAASIPAATFFREPRLVPVICALSVLPLLDGLFNMGCVDFRKHLEFRKDFIMQVGRKLSGFAVVVPLAFVFRSYWALVGGMIAGRVGGLVMSYAMHPFRPRVSFHAAGSLFRYSRWLMLNNGLLFIRLHGSHLMIGRMVASQGLGLYTVAFEMSNLPTSEMANPINRAVFPGYSKLQGNLPALQRGFVSVLGLIALVAVPAGIGMSAIAHLFVPAVLGEQWLPSVPLIIVLAIGGTIHVLQANCQSLYFAMGRSRIRTMLTLFEIATFLPMVAFMLHRFGLQGAAFAFLINAAIIVPINLSLATRLLKMKGSALLRVLWRPFLAAAAMAAIVLLVFPTWIVRSGTWPNVAALAMAIGLGIACYTVSIALLWFVAGRPAGAESWLIERIRDEIDRRSGLRSTRPKP